MGWWWWWWMAYQHCLIDFHIFWIRRVELEDVQEVLQ
jgi:hypothetical protein